jgi:UDP-N-acetylmuramate--L-alanine ligase/UDP-N-acetylenolpyruvoylglucosamine reductase
MKRVHFVGIGGAGLSALAYVMLARGWQVSGSDRERTARTAALEEAGATIHLGHSAEWVQGADVVVISSAIPGDNPERLAAERLGIPVMKRDRWLGEITRGNELVAVAGTHGKTTTSAMIALMLADAGLDPTVVIGGEVPQLGGNARAGTSNLFVIEADEYDNAFLGLQPALAVVLNVEHDHPDIFPDDAAVHQAFRRFLGQVRHEGAIIACMDDPGARQVLAGWEHPAPVIGYGLDGGDDTGWKAGGLKNNEEGGTDFVAVQRGEPFGAFRLRVPGQHNVLNALAAIAVGERLGVDVTSMQATLARFTGAERRFQAVGSVGRVQIFDDYAHHPTEIRATLDAARQKFGERPLWVIFQPHTFSRLEALYSEFTTAFSAADHVIVSDVYAAREQGDVAAMGRRLAEDIKGPISVYHATQDDILSYLLDNLPDDVIVMTLGAGDITGLGPRLRRALEETTEDDRRPTTDDRQRQTEAEDVGELLREAVGAENVWRDEPMTRHTSFRVGGPADWLVRVSDAEGLSRVVKVARQAGLPYRVIGGGSNVLVSDKGIRGVTILNRATNYLLEERENGFMLEAESGVSLPRLAGELAKRGAAGMEWGVGVPGTVGGAVVQNAGAWGVETKDRLLSIECLPASAEVPEIVPAEVLRLRYRGSAILDTRPEERPVVLRAWFRLDRDEPETIARRNAANVNQRTSTQPRAASGGSTFSNPPGDYAGRLIESAGLKGYRVGCAGFSEQHANFIVNHGGAKAAEIRALIDHAQKSVQEQFGVHLEPEVEFVGEWGTDEGRRTKDEHQETTADGTNNGRVRVVVLFGGKSGEHEVSLSSARSVMAALDPERYEVLPVGITKQGQWLLGPDPMKQLLASTSNGHRHLAAEPLEVGTAIATGSALTINETAQGPTPLAVADVVFPVLHGPFGEDGTIQGLLEIADLPYVGSGVAGSAVGMDKVLMKGLFASAGLPQLPYLALARHEWEANPERVMERVEALLPYPVFVKPANLGSSVGISKARTRDELREALDLAARYDRRLLVEQGLERPREIEVSVLGNDEPVASVAGEVVPHERHEFYDYESKYTDGHADLLIPATLSEEQLQTVQEMAIRAFKVVDAAGLSRVDFLMDRETGQFYLNELNTMPGFTATSMYPKLWEASGLPYPRLLETLIQLALERHQDKQRNPEGGTRNAG